MNIESLKAMISSPFELPRPQIKEYYIAYLDVLGYKAFLEKNPDKVDAFLNAINECYQNIVRQVRLANSFLDLKDLIGIRVFSDNVLIYLECTQGHNAKQILLSLIEIVKELQRVLLLDYCIFTRGAISKGAFAVNDFYVFGQALIDAVVYEEKIAKNPRVIIAENVVADILAKNELVNPDISRAWSRLQSTIGVFTTGSVDELANRIINAWKTFDDIFSEIPYIIPLGDQSLLDTAIKGYRRNIDEIARNRNNPVYLERAYEEVKQFLPDIVSILKKLSKEKQAQLNQFEKIMIENSFFKDDDGRFVVDYLNIADYSAVLEQTVLNTLIGEVQRKLEGHTQFIEWMKMNVDRSKYDEKIKKMLEYHRIVIQASLTDDYNDYIKHRDSPNTAKYCDGVTKKHLWSLRYHNSWCERLNYREFSLDYKIDFDISNNVLFVKLRNEAKLG